MLAVFDANVLISAVISERGIPAELIRRWERGGFKLVTSPAILEELARVIYYPRIQEKYDLDEEGTDISDLPANPYTYSRTLVEVRGYPPGP